MANNTCRHVFRLWERRRAFTVGGPVAPRRKTETGAVVQTATCSVLLAQRDVMTNNTCRHVFRLWERRRAFTVSGPVAPRRKTETGAVVQTATCSVLLAQRDVMTNNTCRHVFRLWERRRAFTVSGPVAPRRKTETGAVVQTATCSVVQYKQSAMTSKTFLDYWR